MNKTLLIVIGLFLIGFTACSDDDPMQPTSADLTLNIMGLSDLGATAQYEGWIMVNGQPKTTGVFSVNSTGQLSNNKFTVDIDDLSIATAFILTVEPIPDNDPSPSSVHILAGDFISNSANLTISHGAALGNDFTSSTGKYILATPTDGAGNNENSGIWFLNLSSGSPAVGLTLPQLPAGWIYEGWTVINGVPVTTGTFASVNVVDNSDPYSSTMGGPPFPGEDFLMNAPTGLTFPTNIAGGKAVISIEPVPDNSPNPFLLKPLVGDIPANATDHVTYMMGSNISSFPTGTAVK